MGMPRSSLAGLSHHDKRVVLLSDLAGGALPEGEPALWAPVSELSKSLENCGICWAERHGRWIDARVACTLGAAAGGRSLSLTGSKDAIYLYRSPHAPAFKISGSTLTSSSSTQRSN